VVDRGLLNDPEGPAGTVKDFHVWNQFQWGYFGYETNNLTIDGFVSRGNLGHLPINDDAARGMWFADYQQTGLVIKNADIQGENVGIIAPSNAQGNVVIQDSYFRNATNVIVTSINSVNGANGLPAHVTILRNDRFDAPSGYPCSPSIWITRRSGSGPSGKSTSSRKIRSSSTTSTESAETTSRSITTSKRPTP